MISETFVAIEELVDTLRACTGFRKLVYDTEDNYITVYFIGDDADVSQVPDTLNNVRVATIVDIYE